MHFIVFMSFGVIFNYLSYHKKAFKDGGNSVCRLPNVTTRKRAGYVAFDAERQARKLFYSYWFNLTRNQTRVYGFRGKLSFHSAI